MCPFSTFKYPESCNVTLLDAKQLNNRHLEDAAGQIEQANLLNYSKIAQNNNKTITSQFCE